MTDDNRPDLRLVAGGRWEPADVLADCPKGASVGDYLRDQGWERFLNLGEPDGPLYLMSYRRNRPDGRTEYLLEVANELAFAPYMVVESFPDLMDLLARWAPAVQAAAVGEVMHDVTHQELLPYAGLVETIAARAAHGAEAVLPRLRNELREKEQRMRERRRVKEQ